jgi:hypothetical protein
MFRVDLLVIQAVPALSVQSSTDVRDFLRTNMQARGGGRGSTSTETTQPKIFFLINCHEICRCISKCRKTNSLENSAKFLQKKNYKKDIK